MSHTSQWARLMHEVKKYLDTGILLRIAQLVRGIMLTRQVKVPTIQAEAFVQTEHAKSSSTDVYCVFPS